MRYSAILFLSILLAACSSPETKLQTGTWRGIIELQGQQLPFQFEIDTTDGYKVWLRNATEKILLDEVSLKGDSIDMVLHVFDASLKAKIEGTKMTGTFYKNYAPDASLPFSATFGEDYRYAKAGETSTNFAGKFQVEFSTKDSKYPSVGVFEQTGNQLTGTFLTPTGDYRFLEGNVVNDTLMLSTFDGNHAYVFKAIKKGDSLIGDYYSGKSSHETWKASRNDNAVMPDADTLTFLKPGFEKLEFSFPDLSKNPVSLSDERFKNKVVVLQIFGTWCPNCMDETKFLVKWYNENKDRGVEILGLAYERKDDFAYASERVKKMIVKFNVPYDFVIAGVNDKEKASLTLPALNRIMAFPTTIFIGKDGKVKSIHTGFSGPGTGVYFEQWVQHFNETINTALAESD